MNFNDTLTRLFAGGIRYPSHPLTISKRNRGKQDNDDDDDDDAHRVYDLQASRDEAPSSVPRRDTSYCINED